MNRARKGARVERKLRDYLRCQEHPEAFVVRAAASKGIVDLVVCCPRCQRLSFVSAKSNAWPGKAERTPLMHLAALMDERMFIGRVLAARWPDRAPAPEVRDVRELR